MHVFFQQARCRAWLCLVLGLSLYLLSSHLTILSVRSSKLGKSLASRGHRLFFDLPSCGEDRRLETREKPLGVWSPSVLEPLRSDSGQEGGGGAGREDRDQLMHNVAEA